MQRLVLFPLAFLASIALLASLAACAIPEGGSSAPPLSPSPIPSPSASHSPSPASTPEATKEPTKTPTEVYQPRQVELVFAPDGTTVPDSCKVVPAATADNTLTLNGQPLPDGTVIDSYQNLISPTLGEYHLPTLLIAARVVAIEKLDAVELGNRLVDRHLLCYNVRLPSGDNMMIASVFINSTQSGFQNTGVYELPGTDVAGVIQDQTVAQPTPIKVIRNSDFLALFTSGKIISQQVLLPFAYDYPSTDRAAGENSWRGAIVAALKAGRLPSGDIFIRYM